MRPDRVIGLRAPEMMSHKPAQFPMVRKKILLPFLIIEAKKEANSPGFQATQRQTASPIRRFLKAQNALFGADSAHELCLVWFFAYQGENWRLYACTFKREIVRIYDLWQGRIHSQDDALQLLLIIDYIWSWARDIYRPAVMRLLLALNSTYRDFSPVSPDRFRHSVSISAVTSPVTMFDQDSMHIEIENDSTEPFGSSQERPHQTQNTTARRQYLVKDASYHPFLSWTSGNRLAPPWTNYGSICHSNLVHAVLRFYEVSLRDVINVNSDNDDDAILEILYSSALLLNQEQLRELASFWTIHSPSTVNIDARDAFQVTFFFQTYCDRKTWQIKKVLHVLVWPTQLLGKECVGENSVPEQDMMQNINGAISDIQLLWDRDSLFFALQNATMVLNPKEGGSGFQWEVDDTKLLGKASFISMPYASRLCFSELALDCVGQWDQMLLIEKGLSKESSSAIPEFEYHAAEGDSIIAICSSDWQFEGTKFCLFIFSEDVHMDISLIHKHLEGASSQRRFCAADDNPEVTESDQDILVPWRKTVRRWTRSK